MKRKQTSNDNSDMKYTITFAIVIWLTLWAGIMIALLVGYISTHGG